MKIAIISGGVKSNISELSSKYILEDLKDVYNKNSRQIFVRQVDIGQTEFQDIGFKKDGWKVLGVETNKEKLLPLLDLVIDTTHHIHDDHYHYSNRLGVKNLFKKNISRLSLKSILDQSNIKVNNHINIKSVQDLDLYQLGRKLHLPSVIKSYHGLVPTFVGDTHKDIFDYIRDNKHKDNLFIENYVRGRIYTCIFIKNFRGQKFYNTFIFEHIKNTRVANEYVRAQYLSDDIKSKVKEIGEKILSVMDSNICEVNFIITGNTINSTAINNTAIDNQNYTSYKNQSIYNITNNRFKKNNIKIIVNNCIFTPKYFPGTAFYEILKSHSINILELAENFREK